MKIWVVGLIKRTMLTITLLLGVMVGSFLLFNVAPGDPARVILGPNASEDAVARLRHFLGTDRPLWEQWTSHFQRATQLDLGRSVIDGRSVLGEVLEKFSITAKVGALGAGLALLFSYAINLLVYCYPHTKRLINLVNFGIVTPTFFTGIMVALILGVWLPVIPLTGYGASDAGWVKLILPALIAAFYPIALMTRLLYEKILAVSATDFARAAYSFGFSKWRIFHRTLLRPVAVSWLTVWVNQLSIIFIASFILEVIFTIPGVGPLLINTIQRKDYPMLQGILLVNGIFFISLSWLSDAIFAWLDPRVRQNVAT